MNETIVGVLLLAIGWMLSRIYDQYVEILNKRRVKRMSDAAALAEYQIEYKYGLSDWQHIMRTQQDTTINHNRRLQRLEETIDSSSVLDDILCRICGENKLNHEPHGKK